MILWISTAIVLGIASGLIGAHYIPWFKPRLNPPSATSFYTKGHTVKLYSPVILRGTLWVSSGCLVVMLKTLLEWKSAGKVDEIDMKILWVGIAATAVDKWLTYMDTTVARFRDEKKVRDQKIEEETTRQQTRADFGVKP